VGGRVVPEYTVHVGGGIDHTGATFGRQVLKVPARRAPEALIRLLTWYRDERSGAETALDFLRRQTDDAIRVRLADISKMDETTASEEDFLDLGDAKTFEVKTGPGECAV
jgi:sulfite reductase beta subunit-like hemoprotein